MTRRPDAPTVRKGWGPPAAFLIVTRRSTWLDFWGTPVPVQEVIAATVAFRTEEHGPAEIEAGTNGTSAVEPLIYEDADRCRFTHHGGNLWTSVDDDHTYLYDLARMAPTTRLTIGGDPVTADVLMMRMKSQAPSTRPVTS